MRKLWLALLLCLAVASLGREVAAASLRKVAVVVGANLAPPGRATLRYAHKDAQQVVDALRSAAGFNPQDIALLLDPTPAELLSELDRQLTLAGETSEQTLLFFYYSGHADEREVFPGGQALALSALKARLADPRAKLRLGLMDSCHGGGWTGSKGLIKVEAFSVDDVPELAEEGSILIASSAGQGNAHETDRLGGSVFTHYWNSGLRGAADRNIDGVVTLNEVFEYARALTIRDSALTGQEPQQPSFQMKLSGRRDFPLATPANQQTTLIYNQQTGPTEVVRLSDGLVVVETAVGARTVRLALSSGNYLVRRRTPEGLLVRIVSLEAGNVATLDEASLERTTLGRGQAKSVGDGALELDSPTFADQFFFATLGFGVRHAPVIDPGLRVGAADGGGVLLARLSARLLRKLWWSAPLALVFDGEQQEGLNWFVWAGLPVLSASNRPNEPHVISGVMGAGVDARLRYNERHTFNASLSGLNAFDFRNTPPATYALQLTLGLSETIPAVVTFSLGAALAANVVVDGQFSTAATDTAARNLVLAFGSVQRAGLRPLPLIHVPIGGGWGIDAHVVAAYLPAQRSWVETYVASVSLAL